MALLESITAIRECMESLNLDPAKQLQHEVLATFTNNFQKKKSGAIRVTFNSNWHSGHGPYLEFDDSIKGFGIPYSQFKPTFLDMQWNTATKSLEIKNGNEYSFTLAF